MKDMMKKVVTCLLCLGIVISNTGIAYAANVQEQIQEQDEVTSDTKLDGKTENVEVTGSSEKEKKLDMPENQEEEIPNVVTEPTDNENKIVSMDGQRETDELYGMDENGNTYLMGEDENAAFPVENIETCARSSSVKIVNFRANKNGETVSSSSTTEYKEYSTGAEGYTCGAYGADAAYLGTSDGKVKFMLSGVVGLVDESKVQIVDLDSVKSFSEYYVDGTTLIHRICTNMTTSGWGNKLQVGTAPSYLASGDSYYSYDGHYFYTNYGTMLSDYQADTRSHSVNANNPYYNYYQFLPERSSSNYSGNELSNLINSQSKVDSSSKMYNTGVSFFNYQNTYGVNALLMIGVAANESAWGTSNIAKNKNNLFGINAVDSNPGQANSFTSVDTCIKDYAETYLSKRYLRAGYTYYHGAFLGDKGSGINVSWASDPYWGEKAANVAWNLDKTGGSGDYGKYTIGIKNTINTGHSNVNVRKEATTSSDALYQTGKHSNYAVLIRTEKDGFYEIQSDPVLTSGRTSTDTSSGKYNTDSMYAYISKDYVTVVSDGSEPIVDDTEGIDYSVHAQTYGWMSKKSDGRTAGTIGESKRLEALKINIRNPSVSGSVRYRVHCQTYGWMDWSEDGNIAGTTNESKRLEAIQIELTGEMAEKYDIYYRVHAQTYGWLGWAKNGAKAGTSGESKRLEAIEIKLVEKNGTAPGSTDNSYIQTLVSYRTHVQDYGWQDWKKDGETAGTSGESKRLEAIELKLPSNELSGSIEYRTHVQTYGWQDWKKDGETAGTSGESKRLEAIQIRLTGKMAESYDIYYRVHSQTYGWLDWAKNGEYAGTTRLSKRLEAIEIKVLPKGSDAPGSTTQPYVQPIVLYQTYVQGLEWTDMVTGGSVSGTIGQSKSIEGLKMQLNDEPYSGKIEYKVKNSDDTWEAYVNSGAIAGNIAEEKSVEAFKIQLTGKMEEHYDVYYRAHCQTYGWLGWAKNGEAAGSSGAGKRLEAIQVILVEKGGEAPGSVEKRYVEE